MMKIIKIDCCTRNAGLLFLLLVSCPIGALAPTNFIRPYDANLVTKLWPEQRWYLSNTVLIGSTSNQYAWNGQGHKVRDTQLWNADQNALAMVRGYAQGSTLSNIAQTVNAVDGDNGIRGHLDVAGDFKIHFSYLAAARYYFNKNWWLQISIPVYKVDLKNVTWTDKTLSLTADDTATKTNITNNLAANVASWGDGLNIGSWGKTGPGDLVVMAGWSGQYQQRKPWIKRVDPGIRLGLTLPTGVKKDEDRIMFMPFGNDGSVGLIVGAGLNVNFKHRIDAGIDIELMHVFNNTRLRRIKVDQNQTDFLLLTKTQVQKDPGFTQKFTLYCEPKLGYGFSARVSYQNVRRGQDTYYVVSNSYSSTIANSAESLKEWTTHNVTAQLKWDTGSEDKQVNRPEFNLYFTHPFNGRRSVQAQQFGCGMTLKW